MSTITIPAAVVPRLREGTHHQLAEACSTIKAEAEAHEKDTPPLAARAESDRAWALLDALGWAGAAPESISVDLPAHAAMLRAAIDDVVASISEVIADRAVDEAIRAERVEELQALREFEGALVRAIERAHTEGAIIAVPADVAAQLRRALYAGLARAGADLEEACSTTELGDFASPVGKLRRLFAVLDEVGWRKEPPTPEALTIDRRHLRVVVDTLEDDREGWAWTAEQPQLEDLPGRERAKATAEMIERFLATLPTQAVTLAVPPSLIPRVREGAGTLARDTAEAIDNGENLRDCARRLLAIAALHDALREHTETTHGVEGAPLLMLDVAEHGDTLRQAVAVMLPAIAGWLGEMGAADPSKPECEDELRLMRQLAVQVNRATGGER